MKTVLAAIPLGKHAEVAFAHLKAAISKASSIISEEVVLAEQCMPLPLQMDTAEAMLSSIDSADLIIVDLTDSEPNTMYELGLAHGTGKPVIHISSETMGRPIDLVHFNAHHYLLSTPDTRFYGRLSQSIVEALTSPNNFIHPHHRLKEGENDRTVFISYSHVNKDCLKRLQVHLGPVARGGVVEVWDDTKIKAGEEWQEMIEEALDRSAVAVLLVSADFLNSNFIVENELPPLLQAAKDKGTTILPVVLSHCGFTRDKNLSIFQSVNDPSRPLLTLSEPLQEEIYDRIAARIANDLLVK